MAKSAKKSKEKKPSQDEANAPIDSVSNQTSNANNSNSNIFDSLFGGISEGNAAYLFSDDNPFRRKPNDSGQRAESGAEVSGKTDVGIETFDGSSELKKEKRKKDGNGDSLGETAQSEENYSGKGKKSKRVDFEDFQYGKGSNEGSSGGKDVTLGIKENLKSGGILDEVVEGHDSENKPEKKKKKRKRDEVEAEYEAKKYGVMEQDGEKGEGGGGVVGKKRKEMDSVEDIVVSKEGFDDESKLLRTVFVGNLPLKIKKKELIKEFGKFGEVESVRIRSVPLTDSKVPRRGAVIKQQFNEAVNSFHAYVVFKTEESAQASLAHNMSMVGGHHIRVDRACPPRKKLKGGDAPLYDNRRTVFVGNLPFDVIDEELYRLFNNIKDLESSIEAVRVVRDPGTSLGKGIAYILFKTREAANSATRKKLTLHDRELRLTHAKKADATPSKRKAPQQGDMMNKSPAKRFAARTGFNDRWENNTKSKTPLSYQGLRANKSGHNTKKTYTKNHHPVSQNVSTKQPKGRLQKRPAVAARKAKEAGMKRKMEKQTPDSYGRKKKARKFN